MLTVKDLAVRLNVSVPTIYIWLRQGKLPKRTVNALVRGWPEKTIIEWEKKLKGV